MEQILKFTFLCSSIPFRKYAEAKRCVKNETLTLCKITPDLRDEVNFIYDRFNPFCFNLSDPPAVEKSPGIGKRASREPRDEHLIEPNTSDRAKRSDAVSRGGSERSVSAKPLSFVVVMSLLALRAAVS